MYLVGMERKEFMRKFFPGIKWLFWLPIPVFLDQISKWYVLKHISFREMVSVIPGLHLTLSFNPGVAFSLFDHETGWMAFLLLSLIILICLGLAFWVLKTPYSEKWAGTALMLILGGAIGNVIDRIVYGHVIDFIDLYIKSWHWYTFNLADTFISIGAAMIIVQSLRGGNAKS